MTTFTIPFEILESFFGLDQHNVKLVNGRVFSDAKEVQFTVVGDKIPASAEEIEMTYHDRTTPISEMKIQK